MLWWMSRRPVCIGRWLITILRRLRRAVAIEKNLVAAEPGNLDRLATVGDIYADSTSTALNLDAAKQLAEAAPYWKRMSAVQPGVADGYLQSATVFWDYFEFDEALGQIEAARKRFGDAGAVWVSGGAIDENKREMRGLMAEYVAAADRRGIRCEWAAAGAGEAGGSLRRLVDKATAGCGGAASYVGCAGAARQRVECSAAAPAIWARWWRVRWRKARGCDDLAELAEFSQRHQLEQGLCGGGAA